ncbi:MAG: hypothetical protein IKV64_03585 [Clostridia bacterium]|nr:hypothetical protein [Clostridia bacterium]
MKKIKLLVTLGIITVLLTACGDTGEKILGRWEWGGEVLEFFDDGTYDWGGWGSGRYSITEDRLKLDRRLGATKTYTFKISGKSLHIYNDSDNVTLERID